MLRVPTLNKICIFFLRFLHFFSLSVFLVVKREPLNDRMEQTKPKREEINMYRYICICEKDKKKDEGNQPPVHSLRWVKSYFKSNCKVIPFMQKQ